MKSLFPFPNSFPILCSYSQDQDSYSQNFPGRQDPAGLPDKQNIFIEHPGLS